MAGQTEVDSFTYRMTDSAGATSTATVNVTVVGANDGPIANDDSITTYDNTPQTILNVLGNDTDPDVGDILSIAGFDTVSSQGNAISQNVSDNLVFDIGNRYQYLAQGQTVIDTFSYGITDTSGAASTAQVTMTITGANDAPVTTADTANVQEDSNIAAIGNVLADDSDVDQGTVLGVANAGAFAGQYGQLTLQADGAYSYALNNNALAVQSLAAGQIVTETFAYQATDGLVNTPSTLTVTITGANDDPVTEADTVSVQKNLILAAVGNVLANDNDVDQGSLLSVANAGMFAGQYGQLTLQADGNYTYALNNALATVQALGAGQSVTDNFAYQATDGIASTPSTLTVTIAGTNSNTAPVTAVDTATVHEDHCTKTCGNVLANDSDADPGTVLAVANAGVYAGTYGNLVLEANGCYSYTLNNCAPAVQSLAQGQTVTDTFAYQATDGKLFTPSILTVTIKGANDAPVVVADCASVQEDVVLTASGNVLANDRDIDQGTVLTVANAGTLQGKYGSLILNANGSYTYTLNNSACNVQSLVGGQTVTDSFTYKATDGIATTVSTLAINIIGSNDGVVLNGSCRNDRLTGTDCDDNLYGNGGNDTLFGLGGNDLLDGGSGSDAMIGGTGDDTYVVDSACDIVTEKANEGVDTVKSSVSYTLGANVENLILTATNSSCRHTSDASINGTGNTLDNVIVGNTANNILRGGSGNDTLFGDLGNDSLNGDAGNDILQGGAGNDTLTDTAGNNLLDGGAGTDTLTGDSSNEIYIGGTCNDTINAGNGANVIAFNKGDGRDIVNGVAGTGNTISLGGNFAYADLALQKSGNDLVLNVGSEDNITLKGWYAGIKDILTLQVVETAMSDFNPGSADVLRNSDVETFNFQKMVTVFDQARAANPHITMWGMTDALLDVHLTSSDTAALGGDLAYVYGSQGNLTGFNVSTAESELSNTQFGRTAQTLNPWPTLNTGTAQIR